VTGAAAGQYEPLRHRRTQEYDGWQPASPVPSQSSDGGHSKKPNPAEVLTCRRAFESNFDVSQPDSRGMRVCGHFLVEAVFAEYIAQCEVGQERQLWLGFRISGCSGRREHGVQTGDEGINKKGGGMFENRTRGIFALLALSQGVILWGVLAGVLQWADREGKGDLSQWFGPICWSWFAGIGAELLWSARHEYLGGRGVSLRFSECFGRAFPASLFFWLAGYQIVLSRLDLREVVFLSGVYFGVLMITHWGLPRVFIQCLFCDQHQHRVITVGEEAKVKALSRVLHKQKALGYREVGSFPHSGSLTSRCEAPWQGGMQGLAQVVREQAADHVILAGDVQEEQVARWKDACEKIGVRLVVAQHFRAEEEGRFSWESQGDWCFGLACREPLQSPFNRVLKRCMDIVLALVALILAVVPVAMLTWGAQLRQSRGPLFYRQWRHGRGNRPFRVWKFRTMHAIPMNAAVQARREDSRVYPFAFWLRRHSLDELPQFWNVLIGEMSVVGPRPHFVEHTGTFAHQKRYHVRSFVKPGITGLAQVNGCRGEVRTPEDMERRVRFDIKYIETWSLWLDVTLVARTAMQVFFPPATAY